MSGPLKTSYPATEAIETKDAKLKTIFKVLVPLAIDKFRQFVSEQTCVDWTPSVDPT